MSELDKINNWHEEAMDLAEMAFFAKRRNDVYNYWKFINRALNYEKAAARAFSTHFDSVNSTDNSRSILFQGAVHFALNLDYFDEAKHLLGEALEGYSPDNIKNELLTLDSILIDRKRTTSRILAHVDYILGGQAEVNKETIEKSIKIAIGLEKDLKNVEEDYITDRLNYEAIRISLENKNLVKNPDYQIFEPDQVDKTWIEDKKEKLDWSFWKAYKVYLSKKNIASPTINNLDTLTDDILARIGDPIKPGIWDKRGMVVGDVQSGKTSNYIGLINKAADLGFRIVIVLTGLYENLRQQTQRRIDEGFSGIVSDLNDKNAGRPIGVELYRNPDNLPVHPITRAGEAGDLKKSNLPNLPINTNDYYAIVVKKNPSVLKALLNWLHARGTADGDFKVIKSIPLLVIDDEADYASINVDKDFVSRINSYIRATLALFEQSAFVGYTATPFANVFISDHNVTEGKEISIDGKRFRLGDILFPRDFIINLPPPSNYIGYSKVFDTIVDDETDYTIGDLPMTVIVEDHLEEIPKGHRKDHNLPTTLPASMNRAICCFILACAVRCARGQHREHNSMLIHVSWYVRWIDRIALLVNNHLDKIKIGIKERNSVLINELEEIWISEFRDNSDKILKQIGYDDPRIIKHDWDEILVSLDYAVDKIETRAVHGTKRDLEYENNTPLNYSEYNNGLSVIAVGGNKLSRGLTLEGLSISYFLRASRFYDTLLQMGRWFGYRPGYADLCRLFTTDELIIWYQHIANSTEELKEQFDIMDLAERTPKNFGLKVRSAPGMLMISSAAKIRGATDLTLSFSGELLESYMLSKNDDSINANLLALNEFVGRLGEVSGIVRQNQAYIWENVQYNNAINNFISDYQTNQPSIHPNNIQGYIARQLKHGRLKNWTVVLINNSKADQFYDVRTPNGLIRVGCTFRKEKEEKDAFGNITSNPLIYYIRKSHIISPPHEYLDMDSNDVRYENALRATQNASSAKFKPMTPRGKYIRKYRGVENALLLIYILDTKGFGGKAGAPAVGYALSLPSINNDEKYPYKVNQQFIKELFDIPSDAQENPEDEDEG